MKTVVKTNGKTFKVLRTDNNVTYSRMDRDVFVDIDMDTNFVAVFHGLNSLPFRDKGQWRCPMPNLNTALVIAANDELLDDTKKLINFLQ